MAISESKCDVDNDDGDAEVVAAQVDWGSTRNSLTLLELEHNKNSSDEIANVNFYAVRPEATRIGWNNAK